MSNEPDNASFPSPELRKYIEEFQLFIKSLPTVYEENPLDNNDDVIWPINSDSGNEEPAVNNPDFSDPPQMNITDNNYDNRMINISNINHVSRESDDIPFLNNSKNNMLFSEKHDGDSPIFNKKTDPQNNFSNQNFTNQIKNNDQSLPRKPDNSIKKSVSDPASVTSLSKNSAHGIKKEKFSKYPFNETEEEIPLRSPFTKRNPFFGQSYSDQKTVKECLKGIKDLQKAVDKLNHTNILEKKEKIKIIFD